MKFVFSYAEELAIFAAEGNNFSTYAKSSLILGDFKVVLGRENKFFCICRVR